MYITRVYIYTHTHTHIYFFFFFFFYVRVHPQKKRMPGQRERAGSLDRETSDEGWFILRAGSQQSGTDRDCRVTIHCNIFKHNISATDRRNNCICAHYTVLPVIPRWRFNAWSTVFHVSVIFNQCRRIYLFFFFLLPRLSTSSNEIDFFVTFVTNVVSTFFFRWFNRLDILNESSEIIRDAIIRDKNNLKSECCRLVIVSLFGYWINFLTKFSF